VSWQNRSNKLNSRADMAGLKLGSSNFLISSRMFFIILASYILFVRNGIK
jgi:hypothetical protein